MKNRFEKYLMYNKVRGRIVFVNPKAFELADEAFALFKELYDTHYGTIFEDANLISIHTGGWSDNEELVEEFKETGWWKKNHKITQGGGHYYFDTDFHAENKWKISIDRRDNINLKKLEEKLDNALKSETHESLNEWLKQQNKDA